MMSEQVRVAITGGSGRMGRTLIEAAKQQQEFFLEPLLKERVQH